MAHGEDKEPEEFLPAEKLDEVEQLDLSAKLQALLLKRYLSRLQNGTITDTGMAALQRLLMANGWQLDPAKVPEGLKDMLTSNVSFDDEDDVLPFPKAM